jgi:hypothetical protein
MYLNGWIGLKRKARERHVFTVPAINKLRLESREYKLSFARLHWPAQIGVWNGSGKRFTDQSAIAKNTDPDPLAE